MSYRPEGWHNPYSRHKFIDHRGEVAYCADRCSLSHSYSHDSKEAAIFEEGADAMLKVLSQQIDALHTLISESARALRV